MRHHGVLPVLAGGLLALFAGLAGRTTAAVGLALLVAAVTTAAVVLQGSPARRAERVVVVSLLLWVAVPTSRLPSSLPLRVVLATSLLLGAAALVGPGRLRLPAGAPLVLGLFVVLLASTAGSPDRGAGIRLAVCAVAALVPFCFAAQLDHRGRWTVAASVVSLAVVEALLACVEPWLFPAHLWVPALTDDDGMPLALGNELLGSGLERSQGTFGHPLPLGLLLLVAVALLVKGPLRVRTGHRVLLLLPLLGGLVAAGARASLATAVVVLVLWTGRRPGPLRVYAAAAVVAGSAAVAVSAAAQAVTSAAGSGSFTHRVAALEAVQALLSYQDLAQVLLGNGIASVRRLTDAGLLHNDGLTAVDNQYVSTLVQAGLVGLALLVGALALALAGGRPGLRPAVWCCAASMMLFDVLTWPPAVALLLLVLGLSLSPAGDPAGGGRAEGSGDVTRVPMHS